MKSTRLKLDIWKTVLALLLVSVLARAVALFVCHSVTSNDSFDYARQSVQMATWDFRHYLGYYPPGYPFLLMVCMRRFNLVALVQSVMGVATSIILFGIIYRQTKSLRWAIAAGLMNSLSFNQLLFEHIILSEALARFMMLWTFWQYQSVMESKDNRSLRPFILLGFLVGCTFLTRVNLLPMAAVFMMSLFLNCRINRSPSQLTALILSYSLPVFITVAGLCSFNKITTGAFSPGNELGFALVADHPQMVKWAPDEYADFRDAYVKIVGDGQTPDYSGALWQAIDTVHKKTGISIVSFNKRLIAMSVRIFINHPKEYIETVAVGWYQFFQPLPAFYSAQCRCSNEFRIQAMALFGRLQAAVNPFVMTIFLAACINKLVEYATAVKRAGQWAICLQQTAIVIVLLQSLCIAMIAPVPSDATRHSIPSQPLIFIVAVCFCWQIACRLGRGRDKKQCSSQAKLANATQP